MSSSQANACGTRTARPDILSTTRLPRHQTRRSQSQSSIRSGPRKWCARLLHDEAYMTSDVAIGGVYERNT
jgi:hypothetical protein